MQSRPQKLPDGLGSQLRGWRTIRGKSQLDLSLDSGMSQRQISFIESGRSTPGRGNLLHLADVLDVPFRERNALLLAAGYAPVYGQDDIGDPEMRSVSKALGHMLAKHEPFPAVVMDRYWNVLMANKAAPRFFGLFADLAKRPEPRNLLHLIFDPDGLRPFIAEWEKTAASLLARIRRESVGRFVDRQSQGLIDSLLAYPGTQGLSKDFVGGDGMPVIPLSFIRDGKVLSFFSLVTTVGTPQTISAQELRIECMYPLDEATEALYAELLNEADDSHLPTEIGAAGK